MSILAADVQVNYTSSSLGVGTVFWGVIWSQHKYTFQLCCYIIQLCISKVVCAARASLEVQEKQVFLLFFRELLLAGILSENVPCSNDVTVDKNVICIQHVLYKRFVS